MLKPLYLAVTTWIHVTKVTSVEPWLAKTLEESKNPQINPQIDLAGGHTAPPGSSPWDRRDLMGGPGGTSHRTKTTTLHQGREGGGQHIHDLPLLSPATQKVIPQATQQHIRVSISPVLFVAKIKLEHEGPWHYPKLVILVPFVKWNYSNPTWKAKSELTLDDLLKTNWLKDLFCEAAV